MFWNVQEGSRYFASRLQSGKLYFMLGHGHKFVEPHLRHVVEASMPLVPRSARKASIQRLHEEKRGLGVLESTTMIQVRHFDYRL